MSLLIPSLSTLLMSGLLGCATPRAAPVLPAEGGPAHLVVAHTNDLHAHFSPNRASWLPGEPDIGGFSQISAHVLALEAVHGEDKVLVLDGGEAPLSGVARVF